MSWLSWNDQQVIRVKKGIKWKVKQLSEIYDGESYCPLTHDDHEGACGEFHELVQQGVGVQPLPAHPAVHESGAHLQQEAGQKHDIQVSGTSGLLVPEVKEILNKRQYWSF